MAKPKPKEYPFAIFMEVRLSMKDTSLAKVMPRVGIEPMFSGRFKMGTGVVSQSTGREISRKDLEVMKNIVEDTMAKKFGEKKEFKELGALFVVEWAKPKPKQEKK
jgi:hypothetical protein